jgi:transketolase
VLGQVWHWKGSFQFCYHYAVKDLDVTVLYCTTVVPFDAETLRATIQGQKIVLADPYYTGCLTADICAAMRRIPIVIESIGVPHIVLNHYGTPQQHDEALGFTPQGIHKRITEFLDE